MGEKISDFDPLVTQRIVRALGVRGVNPGPLESLLSPSVTVRDITGPEYLSLGQEYIYDSCSSVTGDATHVGVTGFKLVAGADPSSTLIILDYVEFTLGVAAAVVFTTSTSMVLGAATQTAVVADKRAIPPATGGRFSLMRLLSEGNTIVPGLVPTISDNAWIGNASANQLVRITGPFIFGANKNGYTDAALMTNVVATGPLISRWRWRERRALPSERQS